MRGRYFWYVIVKLFSTWLAKCSLDFGVSRFAMWNSKREANCGFERLKAISRYADMLIVIGMIEVWVAGIIFCLQGTEESATNTE